MKKLCTSLLAALLCICLCVSALAETGVTLVRTYTGGSPNLISDTNRYNNNYAMTDVNLNPLTEEHYYSFMQQKGWITASDSNVQDTLNNEGVLDTDGNIIVPFQYADLKMRSHEWIVAIKLGAGTSDNYDYTGNNKTEFYLISGVDVYNTETGVVASLTRDQYIDSAVNAGHLAIQDRVTGVITLYDANFNAVETLKSLYTGPQKALDKINTFRQDGRYGLKDGQGNVIMEASYRYIYLPSGKSEYATFEKTDANEIVRTGLLSTADGSVIIPAAYDKIETTFNLPTNKYGSYSGYNAFGYFTVVRDNKVGFVDVNGNETVAPKYSKEISTLNGASYSLTDLTGATLIVAADGVETSVAGYKKVTAMSYCSGIFYQVETNDGKYGLIDWHGKEIVPATNDYRMKATGDGKYLIVSPDYKSSELYELIYPASPAAPVAEEPVVEQPAATAPDAAQTADGISNMLAVLQGLANNTQQTPTTEQPAAQPEQPAAQPEQPAAQPEQQAPAQQPTTEAPAQQPAASANPAVALIDNAILLLQTDAAANGTTAVTLLSSAKILLGDANAAAAGLIDSAIALLTVGAAANATSIITLLQTAKTML